MIHAVFNRSGIAQRHSVLPDFDPESEPRLYRPEGADQRRQPHTGARNAIYAEEASSLALTAAEQLFHDPEAPFQPAEITHLIFASCTGFTNPGPDLHLIDQLGLRTEVERYTLGFMGCYAAFPALRMAAQFAQADPHAVVLVVCLELSTLHLQLTDRPDDILGSSLFADGAAAALVSARTPHLGHPCFALRGFASRLLPATSGDMAWTIGHSGFNLVLSSYVPDAIATHLGELLQDILEDHGLDLTSIEHWAVHPGGRAILDRVSTSLQLSETALTASREVLKNYGNMSSPTVLFVLQRLLENPAVTKNEAPIVALAFGPGLTLETALLQPLSAPSTPVAS